MANETPPCEEPGVEETVVATDGVNVVKWPIKGYFQHNRSKSCWSSCFYYLLKIQIVGTIKTFLLLLV